MKQINTFALMMALMAVPMLAFAGGYETAPQVAEAPVAADIVEVGNKICPVSGEHVGGMGSVMKVTHKGKAYNLCCGMCVKDFNKDPEKYAKIADDEVAAEAEAIKK